MATKTSIANIAIGRIGSTRITDIDVDTSNEAIKARDLFDDARDDVLRAHTWNFATRRQKLAQLVEKPEFGYDFAYTLPTGFLRVVSVHGSDQLRDHIEYKLENIDVASTGTQVLVSNWNQVYLRYIVRVTDVNLMTPDFRQCFAYYMASDLALGIKKSQSLSDKMFVRYKRKLASAKSVDGIEDFQDEFPDSSWVTARHGGTEWPR